MPKHIRKKKLILQSLQLKLVGTFVAVSCVAALFQVAVLNYSVMSMIKMSPEASEALAGHLSGLLMQNVLVTLGVLMPVMFGIGVIVTHRVAGPAYAIEKYLREVGQAGERPDRPCRVRKGDELKSLCDAVNVAVEGLTGGAAGEAGSAAATLSGDAEDVRAEDEPPSLIADDVADAAVDAPLHTDESARP